MKMKLAQEIYKYAAFTFALFLLLAAGSKAMAQSNPVPCFTFQSDSIGCTPLTVTISSCAQNVVDQRNLIYQAFNAVPNRFIPGNPVAPGTQISFQYNQPGQYYLTQVITYDSLIAGGGSVRRTVNFSRKVIVLDAGMPRFVLRRCNDYKVRVQIKPREGERFRIDYGDGNSFLTSIATDTNSLDTSYQYTDLADTLKRITVTEVFCNRQSSDTIRIRRRMLEPDTITLFTNTQRDTAFFVFTAKDYWEYSVKRRVDTGYIDIPSIRNTDSSLIVPNIRAGVDTCFKIIIRTPCGDSTSYVDQQLCLYRFQLRAERNLHTLTWRNPIMNPPGYRIIQGFSRNGSFIRNASPTSISPFLDRDLECGVNYTYTLVTLAQQIWPDPLTDTLPIMISLSTPRSARADADANPPAVDNLLVSVNEPSVGLSYSASNSRGYFIFRTSQDPRPFTNPVSTPTPRLSDAQTSVDEFSYCYAVEYEDQCDNRSARSPEICSILLQFTELPNASRRLLNWNRYNGFELYGKATAQELQFLNEGGGVIESLPLTDAQISFEQLGTYTRSVLIRYRIRAFNPANPNEQSFSNIIEYRQRLSVQMPTAFSPNGDNLNDTYMPVAFNANEMELIIYNRWGQPIYSSNSLEAAWDGTFNGVNSAPGVYVYYIRARDAGGNTFENRGTFTLLR